MGSLNTIVPEVLTEPKIYARWKILMMNYLLGEELWDIVVGTEPKPDEANQEAFRIWRKKNGKALHAIQMSCGPKVFSSISEIETAKYAWDHLAFINQSITPENPPQASEPSSAFSQGQSKDDHGSLGSLIYKAVVDGDLERTKYLLRIHPEGLSARLSMGETILHIAVLHDQVQLVEELVKLMSKEELEAVVPYRGGATALHLAVFGGVVKIAEAIVNKNPNLLCIKNQSGYLPVNYASVSGHKDMLRYLYSVTPDEELTSHQGASMFTDAVLTQNYAFALDIHRRFPQLITVHTDREATALENLATIPSAFPSGDRLRFWQRWIYNCINLQPTSADNSEKGLLRRVAFHFKEQAWSALILLVPGLKQIRDSKLKHIQALELLKSMSNQISTFDSSQIAASGVINAVILASQFGTVEVFVEMVKANPSWLWIYTSENGSIFHHAVAYRQEKIWNLIYEFGANTDFGVFVDLDWNTLLHTAGKLAPANRLNKISGAAMQMQWELQWFKEVEMMVPLGAKRRMNRTGQTARELFTEEHKDLVKEGERWMKETANSCMIVATLIATVMFAAAFTVPGGNEEGTGIPIFLKKDYFRIFIVSDAFSLFSSITSVLMFLSILTSRYAEEDFLKSLPKRLIIGLASLFFSIATMMVAFSAAIFLVLGHRYRWAAIPISLLASGPVTLFALLEFPLFVDMVLSTYGPGIFHKQTKPWFRSMPERPKAGQQLGP